MTYGQILMTIPSEVRSNLQIESGDSINFIFEDSKAILYKSPVGYKVSSKYQFSVPSVVLDYLKIQHRKELGLYFNADRREAFLVKDSLFQLKTLIGVDYFEDDTIPSIEINDTRLFPKIKDEGRFISLQKEYTPEDVHQMRRIIESLPGKRTSDMYMAIVDQLQFIVFYSYIKPFIKLNKLGSKFVANERIRELWEKNTPFILKEDILIYLDGRGSKPKTEQVSSSVVEDVIEVLNRNGISFEEVSSILDSDSVQEAYIVKLYDGNQALIKKAFRKAEVQFLPRQQLMI